MLVGFSDNPERLVGTEAKLRATKGGKKNRVLEASFELYMSNMSISAT